MSENNLHPAWSGEVLTAMEDLLDSTQPDGHDRHTQPGRDETDAGLKWLDLAGLGSGTFGKEENGPAAANQVSKIPQRSTCTGFGLWQGKGVKEQPQKPIQQAVPQPLELRMPPRVKMCVEEFFPHRYAHPVAISHRESRQDAGRIHVALMIRREDDWSAQSRQVLPATHASSCYGTRKRQPQYG